MPDVSLIAFGSCRKQAKPQEALWRAVADLRPDAFIWTGDYIYGKAGESSPEQMRAHYRTAAAAEALLRSSVPVIDGVYDDHDYGVNDGGKRFPRREIARQMFLDHVVDAPQDSPRRSQGGGLYGVRRFGQPPHEVKLIMLDTRYDRDDHYIPSVGGSTWLPKAGSFAGLVRAASVVLGVGQSHSGDVLSEEQWQWLERELTNSSAAVHLIVSSVQVLTSVPAVESWGHFPRSRTRLLSLLQSAAPRGALIMSGDVHYGELLGRGGGGKEERAPEVLEVTSSGITHTCADGRINGLLCPLLVRLFSRHRVGGRGPREPGAVYPAINFGSLAFHWPTSDGGAAMAQDAPAPRVDVRVHSANGSVVLRGAVRLGLSAEEEAARWSTALSMPSVYQGDDIAAEDTLYLSREVSLQSTAGELVTELVSEIGDGVSDAVSDAARECGAAIGELGRAAQANLMGGATAGGERAGKPKAWDLALASSRAQKAVERLASACAAAPGEVIIHGSAMDGAKKRIDEAWRRDTLRALLALQRAPEQLHAEMRQLRLRGLANELETLGLDPVYAAETLTLSELRVARAMRAKVLHPDVATTASAAADDDDSRPQSSPPRRGGTSVLGGLFGGETVRRARTALSLTQRLRAREPRAEPAAVVDDDQAMVELNAAYDAVRKALTAPMYF